MSKTKERPEISIRTLGPIPYSYSPSHKDVIFILGLANTKTEKPTSVAYKVVRWNRFSILRSHLSERGSEYLKNKMDEMKTETVNYIAENKKKGKLKSIHTVAVVTFNHHPEIVELIPV